MNGKFSIADLAGNVSKKKKQEVPLVPEVPVTETQPKDNPKDNNELLYQALLGVVPTLIGAAVGGAGGGAIGAKAGVGGLEMYEGAKREKAKAEQTAKEKEETKATKEREFALRAKELEQKAGHAEKELALKEKEFGAKLAEGPKVKEPSGDQSKAALFARRLEQAEGVFGDLEQSGYKRTASVERLKGLLPGELVDTARIQQDQAERNFVNAVLRRESGAAISKSEFDSAERQYFPRPGDSPRVTEQKRMNRLQAIAGMQGEAGPVALSRVPLITGKKTPQGAGVISDFADALGNKAYAADRPMITEKDLEKMTNEQLREYLGR